MKLPKQNKVGKSYDIDKKVLNYLMKVSRKYRARNTTAIIEKALWWFIDAYKADSDKFPLENLMKLNKNDLNHVSLRMESELIKELGHIRCIFTGYKTCDMVRYALNKFIENDKI
jgi:hypothetical protein